MATYIDALLQLLIFSETVAPGNTQDLWYLFQIGIVILLERVESTSLEYNTTKYRKLY